MSVDFSSVSLLVREQSMTANYCSMSIFCSTTVPFSDSLISPFIHSITVSRSLPASITTNPPLVSGKYLVLHDTSIRFAAVGWYIYAWLVSSLSAKSFSYRTEGDGVWFFAQPIDRSGRFPPMVAPPLLSPMPHLLVPSRRPWGVASFLCIRATWRYTSAEAALRVALLTVSAGGDSCGSWKTWNRDFRRQWRRCGRRMTTVGVCSGCFWRRKMWKWHVVVDVVGNGE